MAPAAEAAEGACPRAPLPAQPPSVTEQSIDLHYWFPGSFSRERGGGWALGVHGPSLGLPLRPAPAESGLLPGWPAPGVLPGPPFFSPPEPSQPGLSGPAPASGLSRCSLLRPGSHPWDQWPLLASPVGHPPHRRNGALLACLRPLPRLLRPQPWGASGLLTQAGGRSLPPSPGRDSPALPLRPPVPGSGEEAARHSRLAPIPRCTIPDLSSQLQSKALTLHTLGATVASLYVKII